MSKQITRLALGGAVMALASMGALLGTAGVANATPSCVNFSVSENASGVVSGGSCDLGDLTFTFTGLSITSSSVSPPNTGGSLTIESSGTTVTPGDINLEFQIAATYGVPADVDLDYTVTSTSADISGIDAEFPNGTNGSISEQACSVAFVGGSCPSGKLLASIDAAIAGSNAMSASFGPDSTIYIEKDITSANPITFSSFNDSVIETPEPITLSLFGAGLAGIGYGAARRRNKAAKAV